MGRILPDQAQDTQVATIQTVVNPKVNRVSPRVDSRADRPIRTTTAVAVRQLTTIRIDNPQVAPQHDRQAVDSPQQVIKSPTVRVRVTKADQTGQVALQHNRRGVASRQLVIKSHTVRVRATKADQTSRLVRHQLDQQSQISLVPAV